MRHQLQEYFSTWVKLLTGWCRSSLHTLHEYFSHVCTLLAYDCVTILITAWTVPVIDRAAPNTARPAARPCSILPIFLHEQPHTLAAVGLADLSQLSSTAGSLINCYIACTRIDK